jgi:Membrane transporters of cations and cationic drugs
MLFTMTKRPPKRMKNDAPMTTTPLVLPQQEFQIASNSDSGRMNIITKRIYPLSLAYGVPVLVTSYIMIWVLFHLLTHSLGIDSKSTASSNAKSPSSEVILVISCEALKFFSSLTLFICQNSVGDLLSFSKSSSFIALSVKYLPVAICYALYNNLMFGNLKNVSPTLYLILVQSRLLLTAIVWQIFFKTSLSKKKVAALILITLGIFVKDFRIDDKHHNDGNNSKESVQLHIFPIIVQTMCGVMASLCNEKMLKNLNYNQHLQNMLLYLNSIIVNVFIAMVLSVRGNLNVNKEIEHLASSKLTEIIIILLVGAGILSAMMLKYVGSVSKGVAAASIMALMPLAEYYWFGHTCNISDLFSVGIVTTGVILYTVPNELTSMEMISKLGRMYNCCSCSKKMKAVFIRHILFLIGGVIMISQVSFLHKSMHSTDLLSGAFIHHGSNSLFQPLTELRRNSNQTCSRQAMHRKRPDGIRLLRYERVEAANEILAYITETIKEKSGAPVAIAYGSMLHEYRSGYGPCIMLNFDDKDVDILVFPKQFQMILAMDEYLRETWKWQIHTDYKDDLFLFIRPMNDKRKNRSYSRLVFQIDVYSFMCNHEQNMLEFPYDNHKLTMQGVLPLLPYKTIMTDWNHKSSNHDSTAVVSKQVSQEVYMHVPFDATCYLSNMYGSDFMTPKETWNRTPYGDLPCKDIET